MTSIGNGAFYICVRLRELHVDIKEPLILSDEVFLGVNRNLCKLYVPLESVELYKATDVWKDFILIEGVDAIRDITADKLGFAAPIYNLQGVQMKEAKESLPAGIYIQGGKKIIVR